MKTFSILKGAVALLLTTATPAVLQAADRAGKSAAGAASGEASPNPGASAAGAKPAAAAGKSSLAKQDEQFVLKAAQGGMVEVRLGELASQKGGSAQVKEFGSMMVKDHGKANQELTELAGKKGVALSTELDSKHQSTVDRLGKLTGDAFDKAYTAEMVADHKKDVAEFEKAAKSATDPDIKAWAEKTLPTLQAHLQHAQGLSKGGKQ
jgi:putative membrane protein